MILSPCVVGGRTRHINAGILTLLGASFTSGMSAVRASLSPCPFILSQFFVKFPFWDLRSEWGRAEARCAALRHRTQRGACAQDVEMDARWGGRGVETPRCRRHWWSAESSQLKGSIQRPAWNRRCGVRMRGRESSCLLKFLRA
jgi:hypothetical protein